MNVIETIKELSVDEKIRLLAGVGDWHTYDCNKKVPTVMMTDGPHGLRKLEEEKVGDIEASKPATCFPTASAMAASWNPDLTYKMAQAIAREAKKEKISIVLGCGINIKRSPFCGRNFEYFSEDPFLTGKLATAYINGMQSMGIGTSLKHFAVNSQETRRMTSNSQVDERTLREIYLSAFEETVKNAKPTTIMASYNRINGEYGAKNKHLLTDILRNEWGYEGAVISDWGATNDVVNCMRNGLTLEMPDPQGYHTKVLKEAYEKGEISEEELNAWAGNVLEKISLLSSNVEEDYQVDMEAQNQLARELEDECAVLLKNEGALPVRNKKILVVGELAKHMRFQGGGSSHIQPAYLKNAIDSLKDAGYEVIYTRGYRCENDRPDEILTRETLKCIRENYNKNDTTILFFLGLTDAYEGEGYDRTGLDIPFNQTDLLERVVGAADYDNIAVVSFGGAPMDFSFDKEVSAVLHMYLGGQAVGEAVADLVSGKVNPSGKLAETVPLVRTDTPAWRYFAPPHDDVEYREGLFVGYRYYESFKVPVKYPFGYGLSYTRFKYSDLVIPEVFEGKDIAVRFKIKNEGMVAGAETAQVYIVPEKENFIRSRIELKGFAKVYLEPGEEREVSVTLNDRSFSVYDVDKSDFSVIGGVYSVAVGASVNNIRLSQNIVVQGNKYFRDEKALMPDYFKQQPHGMEISKEQFEVLLGRKVSEDRFKKRGEYTVADSYCDVTKKSLFGFLVRGAVGIGLKFMFPGKSSDDPAFMMVKMGLEEGNLEGLIATSGGVASPKLVDMLVYNANRKYGKAFVRMFKG